MRQSLPKQSIVMTLALATIGRTDEVIRLFDSLVLQENAAFEVIVADQNEDDRLVPIVKTAASQGLNIIHVRLDKPNQYAARTLGIKMARGQYIAFPDDDCWYEKNTINQAIHTFESTAADGVIARWRDASTLDGEARQGTIRWEAARKFRSAGTSMIVQFYKTDVIKAIGGFDKRMGLGQWFGGSEDADILFTVLRNKMKLVHAPQVVVRHRFDAALVKADFNKIRSRARGTGALYAKHKLPFWVILRGFLAPILTLKLANNISSQLIVAWGILLGRLEGYLKWKFGTK